MPTTAYERLLDRIRIELGDLEVPYDFEFVGDGVRDHFNVEHRPLNPATTVLYQEGQSVVDPGYQGVQIDYDAGIVTFAVPPPAGELWEVEGTKWRFFSDTDHEMFLNTSLAMHTHNRGDSSGGDFTINDIKPVEEYPVALLAVIQALWALATDAASDIDIMAPDGVNIPRSERYRQYLQMIEARKRQYEDLAAALNIGIAAIEVYTLRRTAKLTNRLVPVYLPQEYDDGSRPKRVYYPPMLQGTQPVKTEIENYDHHIVTGDPYSQVLDFGFDLTGCEIKNSIRKVLPQSRTGTVGPAIQTFTMSAGPTPSTIQFSLTGKETRTLPYNSYWEVQIRKPDEEESRSYMRGVVYATNNEIVSGTGTVVVPVTPP